MPFYSGVKYQQILRVQVYRPKYSQFHLLHALRTIMQYLSYKFQIFQVTNPGLPDLAAESRSLVSITAN